ncbi:hypothetical protein [Streptomyces sp. NPDC088725]|uniref:hypothetical protein n=1 Tax=Streptomyces sp. NPDC088725 TaxID=3365873 RepID=UPI0037F50922
MSASITALVIGIVGVAGTLASGLLAHRSALRTKQLELDRSERQKREEWQELARRENLAARRMSYVTVNQRLRNHHDALWDIVRELRVGRPVTAAQRERAAEARQAMGEAYAEAQMIVSDDVLVVVADLTHRLRHISNVVARHLAEEEEADEDLDALHERLLRASESLYEVRQTMRNDLGITSLPIGRPTGHGAH